MWHDTTMSKVCTLNPSWLNIIKTNSNIAVMLVYGSYGNRIWIDGAAYVIGIPGCKIIVVVTTRHHFQTDQWADNADFHLFGFEKAAARGPQLKNLSSSPMAIHCSCLQAHQPTPTPGIFAFIECLIFQWTERLPHCLLVCLWRGNDRRHSFWCGVLSA